MRMMLACGRFELLVIPTMNESRTIAQYALTIVSECGTKSHTIQFCAGAAEVQRAAYHFAECYEEALHEGFEMSSDMERLVSPSGYELLVGDALNLDVSPGAFGELLRAVKYLERPGLLQ